MADGFEIIEAMTPTDILMRGEDTEVVKVSIDGPLEVASNNGIVVKADIALADTDLSDADLLVLPGGMPGAENLANCEPLRKALLAQNAKGGLIGAICAAPWALGAAGLLKGKAVTCYPGFEQYMDGATITGEQVTVCGNITTAKGPGAAMAFGYELLAQLTSQAAADELKGIMQYIH